MTPGGKPGACDACLRRAWLVGSLSARIERSLEGRPGNRARELLALGDETLTAAVGGRPEMVRRAQERKPELLRGAVAGAGSWACCSHDPAFPQSVRRLDDAPRVLFGRGDPRLLEGLGSDRCVTIVGARRPSAYGREMAEQLGRELGAAGLVVVSGMALGIDSCAHAGALAAAGSRSPCSAAGPTSRTRCGCAISTSGSASAAWSSASCRPRPRRAAGPFRPATGSWRSWER